jgi:hypothetical protein
MSFEEKRAWIMLVVSVCAYAIYVSMIVGRADAAPLVEVTYAATMIWSIGGAIVAAILLNIMAAIAAPREADRTDERDREIHRFGQYVGQSFVVLGGVTALGLALAEAAHFWIANAIYLAFVLSAVLGSTARLVAYRRGFQPW